MRSLITVFSAITLSAAMASAAQAAPVQDLREIYDLAKTYDARYGAAVASLEASREAQPIAKSALLPQFDFLAQAQRSRADIRGADTSDYGASFGELNLGQTLYDRGAFQTYAQSKHVVKEAEANFRTEEHDLVLRVAEAYFLVLAAQDNLEFTQSEKKAIYRQLDQATQRYEVGLIAITSVYEAQASYDASRSAEITAKNTLDNAIEALREIIGRNPGTLAILKSSFKLRKPEPANMDYWTQQALNNNSSIQKTEETVEISRKEVEIQKSGHYPVVNLFANAGTYDSTISDLSPSFVDNDATIGVQLRLPIYTGGRITASTRQARHNLNASLQGLEAQKRAATRQVNNSFRAIESSIEQVKALKAAQVSAESKLKATNAGYEVGNRTLVDVLNAQRDVFASLRDYAQARYTYILGHLYLRDAAGTLTVSDIDLANSLLKRN